MSSDEDSPPAKRARGESNFGAGGGGGDDTAESQLEAMLRGATAAVTAAAPQGFAGGFAGAGGFPGMPAAAGVVPGMPGMQDLAMGKLPKADKVQTTSMDFSKLNESSLSKSTVTVQKELVEPLMTPEHRRLLTEETGANVEWVPDDANVNLSGSAEQVKRGQRLLARVMMHSRWGYSEAKVRRLLRPRKVESVLCRLSPMNTLRNVSKTLTPQAPLLSIGKDKGNDVAIPDALVSRQHCVLELDEERGAVYVLDCSTNGTFLNGMRLPGKTVGKVLLSHGDELLLKDPKNGEQEFGWIVNLNELVVREEAKLEAPRRLLTPEESAFSNSLRMV